MRRFVRVSTNGASVVRAAEARAAGFGGVTAVARATGIARSTIDRGLHDLAGSARSENSTHWRWTAAADAQGSDAARRPAAVARARDARRSDATVLWCPKHAKLATALRDMGIAFRRAESRNCSNASAIASGESKEQGRRTSPRSRRAFEHINAQSKRIRPPVSR